METHERYISVSKLKLETTLIMNKAGKKRI